MSRATYRLPSGESTTSVVAYVKAWKGLTNALEDALYLKTIGFDPHLLMRDAAHGATVEIPVWFAERLVKALGLEQPAAASPRPKRLTA